MRLPVFSRLVFAAIILSIPAVCLAGFDLSKLDSRIDFALDDSSMADAVAVIAQAARIDIAAPTEPSGGLTASLKHETVRNALDTLAKISGLSWHIENTVVIFKKPVLPAEQPPQPRKTITPDEGMTAFLASLSDMQLFFISRGAPLPYSELSTDQQEIVCEMFPQPNGDAASPKPEDIAITFRVMPALVVPKTTGGPGWTLRLDSTPFVVLSEKGR